MSEGAQKHVLPFYPFFLCDFLFFLWCYCLNPLVLFAFWSTHKGTNAWPRPGVVFWRVIFLLKVGLKLVATRSG